MNPVMQNRKMRKYNLSELSNRLLWFLVVPLFRLSPRVFWSWRCLLLRLCGAKIGAGVRVEPTVQVFLPKNISIGSYSAVGRNVQLYALGEISVGEMSTISQNAHLCAGTHDYLASTMPLMKTKIVIGDRVWVAADAFLGPSVKIISGTVIGARSVVTSDISVPGVYAGNPTKLIKALSRV